MIGAHQGDQPLTPEDAAQQMKNAWTRENEISIAAWDAQREQDQAEQNEQARIDRESEELRQAQQEKEAEELRKEAEKKKPKISNFDRSRIGPGWIEPRPAEYALNKVRQLGIRRARLLYD